MTVLYVMGGIARKSIYNVKNGPYELIGCKMNQIVRYLFGNIHPCEYPIVGHFGHFFGPMDQKLTKMRLQAI